MNISGFFILLIVLASMVLAAIVTVATMRFLARKFDVAELMDNGVRLTEEGIEYVGFLFSKKKNTFAEIQSVEVASYFDITISILLFRYGLNIPRIPPKLFSKFVIIQLKRANPFEYLFFTPTNAENFVEQLKQHINRT
jgi:hypothetical protein